MHISLSTIHGSDNYGAVLQAACLARCLGAFGTVEVLDHRPMVLNAGYLQDCLPYQPLRRRPNPQFASFLRKHARMRRVHDELLPLGPRVRHRPRTADYGDADVAVVGSDEVWSDLWGYQEQFFLAAAPPATRRVAYAVSAGRSTSWRAADRVAAELERFDTVLVRDENTARLCAEVGRPADDVVCDPVLLVDPDDLRRLAAAARPPAPPAGSYVLLYLESCRPQPEVAIAIDAFGGPPRTIASGFPQMGAEHRVGDGPAEFLQLVDNAALVITTMFHGVVSALALDTPVAVIRHPAKSGKIDDLLARIDADVLSVGDDIRIVSGSGDVELMRRRSRQLLADAVTGAIDKSNTGGLPGRCAVSSSERRVEPIDRIERMRAQA